MKNILKREQRYLNFAVSLKIWSKTFHAKELEFIKKKFPTYLPWVEAFYKNIPSKNEEKLPPQLLAFMLMEGIFDKLYF